MEKINSKKELLERVKDLHAVEELAKKSYLKDIAIFENEQIKRIIEKIELDEERHIALLNSLIKILERK